MGASAGKGGRRDKREKPRSSGRYRTLVGGFKADRGRPRSGELDTGWDEIASETTPTTPLGEELSKLIEDTQQEQERIVVESVLEDRDNTPLRVDLSDFGTVPLPEYANDVVALETRMRDRFDVGDFAGAYEAAQLLLQKAPDRTDAKRVLERASGVLLDMYGACLGPFSGVPYLALSMSEVLKLGLDHRAGFVLSQVDGVSSFEEILDVTGMSRLESLRILCDLLIAKVISIR